MKLYYYYILTKIYLKKGAKKMKHFILGFTIGFAVIWWVSATITNTQNNLQTYMEMHDEL